MIDRLLLREFKDAARNRPDIIMNPSESIHDDAERLDFQYATDLREWVETKPHIHERTDEYYIVLDGFLDMKVAENPIHLSSGKLLGIRGGMKHRVVRGSVGGESLRIFVYDQQDRPLASPDPNTSSGKTTQLNAKPILLDLYQRFIDYPLGACLPANHDCYTPLLDFTCVFGVDPHVEWRTDQLHYHTLREEYFFVIRGKLEFLVDDRPVCVHSKQMIGVKPYTVHQVIGGEGPVDVLFFRAPGGRGDKVIMEKGFLSDDSAISMRRG